MLARWPSAWQWAIGGFGIGALGGLAFAVVLKPGGPARGFSEPGLAELSALIGAVPTLFLLCALAFGAGVGVPVALRLRRVLQAQVAQ